MCLVLCYFTYFVTDPEPSPGFFKSEAKVVALRVFIVLFTLQFVAVQVKRLQYTGKRYFTLKNLSHSLATASIYIINLWVVIEHSRRKRRFSQLMLVQITSVQSLHMWYRFYRWFRLFPNTAIYIKMITETIYDIKNFLLILQIVLCAFGNSLLIVDRYQR